MKSGMFMMPIDAWAKWWRAPLKFPLSGDVIQDINPVTHWLSPQLEFNFAGDQALEAKVVAEVASYGKQLGVLSEAVLALAKDNNSPEIKKLAVMVEAVEKAKTEHQAQEILALQRGLRTLQSQDPDKLKALLTEFQ